jgi:hypothetical protein
MTDVPLSESTTSDYAAFHHHWQLPFVAAVGELDPDCVRPSQSDAVLESALAAQTVAIDSVALAQELGQLRKGSGVRHPGLLERLGPQTRRAFGIDEGDSVATARKKIDGRVRALLAPISDELQTAALAALALTPTAPQANLIDRQRWLANRCYFDVRTARRRIDAAFAALIDAIVDEKVTGAGTAPVDDGWSIRTFSATLRLDGCAPELVERRVISVTAAQLDTIILRLAIPPNDDGVVPAPVATMLSGGTLIRHDQPSASNFEYTMEPSRILMAGDEHEYVVRFALSPGQTMRPHYVYLPLTRCDELHVTVKFDPRSAPTHLWCVAGRPLRMVDDPAGSLDPVRLDDDGQIRLSFRRLRPGLAYGVKWLPPEAHS